jgi:hypothetical protein
MKRNGFTPIIILLLMVGVLLIAGGALYYQIHQDAVSSSANLPAPNPPCCKNDAGVESSSLSLDQKTSISVATSGPSTSESTAPPRSTTPPIPPPVCSFTNNPSRIVVPESSHLYYSCQHVTTCNISGGQFGNYPGVLVPVNSNLNTASGTQMVQPSMSTFYELDCAETDNGANYKDELQVDVIVDTPGVISDPAYR